MYRPLLLNSGAAFANQAMLSGMHFLITIILLKAVTKVEFGYYSIAYSASLFVLSIQSAIVTTPLAVLLAKKGGSTKLKYVTGLRLGQFLVALPTVATSILIIGLLHFFVLDPLKAAIAASLSIALIGILEREFTRAYHFAEEAAFRVLKIDFLYAVLYLGLILSSFFFFHLTVPLLFLFMGLSSFLVSPVVRDRRALDSDLRSIAHSYGENWQLGKWAVLGVLVTHLQNYSYLYIMGALLGAPAVADVSAARLLLMPFLSVQTGWNKIAVPHGARLREQKQIRLFYKYQLAASAVYVTALVFYVTLLLYFSDFVSTLLLTDKYRDSFHFLPYWTLIFAVNFIALSASVGLQVAMDFEIIAKINAVTMLGTVALAYLLITGYGVEGGLLSILAGFACLGVALWYVFSQIVFGTRQSAPNKNTRDHPGGIASRQKRMSISREGPP